MPSQADYSENNEIEKNIFHVVPKQEKYQQLSGEWLVHNGILSQKSVGTSFRKPASRMQDLEIAYKSEYGHLKFSLICPLCQEKILRLSDSYPESISCPYCKTEFEFKELFQF